MVIERIENLVLDPEIWVRNSYDEEALERYQDSLEDLPAIIVDRETKKVLEGWHRVEAHKRAGLEEIEVEYEDCPPELMKARAYALNAKHGLPVDNEIRDKIIVQFREGDDSYDPKSEEEIAQIMGISRPRVSQVIKNLLGANIFLKDKAKTREATRLYLSGMSQAKVAESFGVHQTTISSIIRDYMKRKELISAHLKAGGHLKSVVEYPDRGPWGDAKYPGNNSGYLQVDLLDFYQPKSILDPMEGSGTLSLRFGFPCLSTCCKWSRHRPLLALRGKDAFYCV